MDTQKLSIAITTHKRIDVVKSCLKNMEVARRTLEVKSAPDTISINGHSVVFDNVLSTETVEVFLDMIESQLKRELQSVEDQFASL